MSCTRTGYGIDYCLLNSPLRITKRGEKEAIHDILERQKQHKSLSEEDLKEILSRQDILTQETAKQILENDKTYKKLCL